MKVLVALLTFCISFNSVLAVAAETKPQAAAPAAEKSAEKGKRREFILAANTVFKPDKIVRQAKPGDTLTEKVIVRNDTLIELEADLQVFDMYTDINGKIVIQDQVKLHKAKDLVKQPSLGTNIIVSEKVVKLKPKEIKTYTLTFKIPEDAKGSYYFMYTVQPLRKYNQSILNAKKGASKKAVLGMMMSVHAPGVIWIKGKEDLTVSVKSQSRYNPATKQLQVQSEIKNLGDGFLRGIVATAVVLDSDKKVVAKFDLSQQGSIMALMPKTVKRYLSVLETSLSKGEYQLVLTFQDENQKLLHTETSSLKVN